jgi:hypothetical protein
VARDPSRNPIYQTLFSFDAPSESNVNILQLLYGHTYDVVKVGGLDFQPFKIPETTSQMDISLIISDSGSGDVRFIIFIKFFILSHSFIICI